MVERRLLYSHCISSYRISLKLVISLLIIQQVSETIEKVLRQLEAQGESIDEQRVLIQQIISKYPPEVVTKLEETKEPLRPWSIKSLRKAICHYVTVQENVQCYVSSVNTNVKGQHFLPRQLTSDSHRPSADLLTANSQRGSQQEGQIKALLHFIFCKGNHFNDMCDKFTTLTERKQILSQQRRCFICLKVGHVLIRIVLVLRRRYVVTVVEKDIIIDACVHRSFQDRKQMPYWSIIF